MLIWIEKTGDKIFYIFFFLFPSHILLDAIKKNLLGLLGSQTFTCFPAIINSCILAALAWEVITNIHCHC